MDFQPEKNNEDVPFDSKFQFCYELTISAANELIPYDKEELTALITAELSKLFNLSDIKIIKY